jgi:hypothetical protein
VVFEDLRQRLGDNQLRTKGLADECLLINHQFQHAGLRYLNLKGFSLIPHYCPEPSLRYQLDLDFLMCSTDAAQCCDILSGLGYEAIRPDDRGLEFRAGMGRVPSIRDLYKPKQRRSVEVHFRMSLPEKAEDLLARSQLRSVCGCELPVLADVDMFLAQTLHVFKHLTGEWTRLSWLLEFKAFVDGRRSSLSFWREVRAAAERIPQSIVGLGVVIWLATQQFGPFAPPDLNEWTVDVLPKPVRLWLERYGRTALLTDFPGTKLYLLLKGELAGEHNARSAISRGKLLPLNRPPQVAYAGGGSIGSRVRASIDQLRFTLFRLRFHVVESSRYLVEAQRWKRIVNDSPG